MNIINYAKNSHYVACAVYCQWPSQTLYQAKRKEKQKLANCYRYTEPKSQDAKPRVQPGVHPPPTLYNKCGR
jgi:hypothetical protein